jgi:choline dehydrogenase-like flavoprotein
MLLDVDALACDRPLQTEVCIIGAGAVGLAIAARLARAGRNVVVLEGGGATLERASQDLQHGISVGHPFHNIGVGRYRVLGGSTTFWGGQVMPLGNLPLQTRKWMGDDGWPIAPEELDPYYKTAYGLLGLGDAEPQDQKVWNRLGIAPDLGRCVELTLTRWVPQRNFSRLFRSDINNCPNLKVVVHANVTGFAMDERRKQVTRIEAKSLSGRTVMVTAATVVLACGSLEIPRLLLHPSADGERLPWHANEWLGRGLIDHLHGNLAEVDVTDHDEFHRLFDSIYLDGFKYYPRIRLSPRLQEAEQTIDVSGEFFYETEYTQHLENIKMFLRSLSDARLPDGVHKLPGHVLSVLRISAPLVWRYLMQRRSYKPRNARVRLGVSSEQLPLANSRVSLGHELDAIGMRRIVVDWRIDGREIRSLAIFARAVGDALATRKVAHLRLDDDLANESPAFLSKLSDGIHQMGTTRMGSTSDKGVVDRDLRVYGTDNLYVAGQAVFPFSGIANPTFTAIALGLRLCDHVECGHA